MSPQLCTAEEVGECDVSAYSAGIVYSTRAGPVLRRGECVHCTLYTVGPSVQGGGGWRREPRQLSPTAKHLSNSEPPSVVVIVVVIGNQPLAGGQHHESGAHLRGKNV